MALAIFDLDNTLISGDSDYLWGKFLIKQGLVDAENFEQQNDLFYEEYKKGSLDIMAYQRFSLAPIANRPMEELNAWHQQFMAEFIQPIYLDKAQALVNQHREKGDTLLVITATNSFVTRPIAKLYGIENLLGTDPEMKNGTFTGEVDGIPTFQHGKVERLNMWLAETGETLENSYFYSDSHNDIPLLEEVTFPTVVDADDQLLAHAQKKGWPSISLR
ncbi:HAD family phosphatase [Hydrogenovibrio sp. JE_KL2]|uniref:histidinol-phosphatase n=1 Tax=Hydrogenovibrio sp. JE_KL2 TaxID=2651188 RepID=UPI00128E73A6|nr:HAD family hydrolase [Hydrogenovibrio sp. JE_KL2]MPQ76171.1 HAD family hydrolase [Hydrogenovibrio sp. JE_KL2]